MLIEIKIKIEETQKLKEHNFLWKRNKNGTSQTDQNINCNKMNAIRKSRKIEY